MDFPGNNTMGLCEAAMIEIVEKSLNEGRTNGFPIRVTQLVYHNLEHVVTFTTDVDKK